MKLIIITVDFLRYDHTDAFAWARSSMKEYTKHYTHLTFTVPVFKRFWSKLPFPTFITNGNLLEHHFSGTICEKDIWETAEREYGGTDYMWIHDWKSLHNLKYFSRTNQKITKNPQRVSLYDNKIAQISNDIRTFVERHPEAFFIISADHGIVLDPVGEGFKEGIGIKQGIEYCRVAGRTPCEGTLHVPLFTTGSGVVTNRTHHDSLAEFIKEKLGKQHDSTIESVNWTNLDCEFVFKKYNYDGNTVTASEA